MYALGARLRLSPPWQLLFAPSPLDAHPFEYTPSSTMPPSPRNRSSSPATAPSAPHLARRRKGTPSKSPSKTKTSTATPSVNVSLLLRALLREGASARGLDNLRASPSSTNGELSTSKDKKLPKKERDTLPPAPAGYGRGKRSASAQLVVDAGPADSSRGAGDVGHQSRGRDRLAVPSHHHSHRTQHKRAASTDPSPGNTSSSAPRDLSPSRSASLPRPRATSAGPPTSPHMKQGGAPHDPSPLARSFSFNGQGEQAVVATLPVIKRSSSSASSAGKSSASASETEGKGTRDTES